MATEILPSHYTPAASYVLAESLISQVIVHNDWLMVGFTSILRTLVQFWVIRVSGFCFDLVFVLMSLRCQEEGFFLDKRAIDVISA